MKKLINEVRRMQKLAGLLKENEDFSNPERMEGYLEELVTDETLPQELKQVGEDLLQKYPKAAKNDYGMVIEYNPDGSIGYVEGDLVVDYKKEGSPVKFDYSFQNGEMYDPFPEEDDFEADRYDWDGGYGSDR